MNLYQLSSSFKREVRPCLIFRQITQFSSPVVKGVSCLLLSWGGELGLFLEVQQVCQTSIRVWGATLGSIRVDAVESGLISSCRGAQCPFDLWQVLRGSYRDSIGETGLLLRCEGKVWIPLESNRGNRPSSRDELGSTWLFLCCGRKFGVPLRLQCISCGTSWVA